MERFTIRKVLNGLNVEFGQDDRDVFAYAPDLARALGYTRTSDLLKHVDDEDRGTAIRRTPGGTQKTTVVYRDGILEAVFRSNLPNAKEIKAQIKAILRELEQHGAVIADDITAAERARVREILDCKEYREVLAGAAGVQQHHFIATQQLLYRTLFGMSAAEIRRTRKQITPGDKNVAKNYLTAEELERLAHADRLIRSAWGLNAMMDASELYHIAKRALSQFVPAQAA